MHVKAALPYEASHPRRLTAAQLLADASHVSTRISVLYHSLMTTGGLSADEPTSRLPVQHAVHPLRERHLGERRDLRTTRVWRWQNNDRPGH